jgi:anaerobic ribonucleoside-triphosphate reductase activating protein
MEMEALEKIQLRVAGYIEESIVDGPGLRFVLFLQGCHTHCKGCQNPQTWDFQGGTLISAEEIYQRIQADPLIHGVTFSGGEPFEQTEQLIPLASQLRSQGYHLMAFTGYTWDVLCQQDKNKQFLELLDILVDGPFLEEEKSLELRFRGSKNQRIINVSASISAGWIPLLDVLHSTVER